MQYLLVRWEMFAAPQCTPIRALPTASASNERVGRPAYMSIPQGEF